MGVLLSVAAGVDPRDIGIGLSNRTPLVDRPSKCYPPETNQRVYMRLISTTPFM